MITEIDKWEILHRWNEYTGEKFNGEREQPAVPKNKAGPEILRSGVSSALDKRNRNKTAAADKFVIEI